MTINHLTKRAESITENRVYQIYLTLWAMFTIIGSIGIIHYIVFLTNTDFLLNVVRLEVICKDQVFFLTPHMLGTF